MENEAREEETKKAQNNQSCPEGIQVEKWRARRQEEEAEAEDDEMKQMKMMMGFGSFPIVHMP